MGRIPLIFDNDALWLNALIQSPRAKYPTQRILFLIDTGCTESFICPVDVKRLQIPLKDRKFDSSVEIGGSKYREAKLDSAWIHVLAENKETPLRLKVEPYVLKTSRISKKKLASALSIPSILGLDFLKSQKISLHVYMHKNKAYLETED